MGLALPAAPGTARRRSLPSRRTARHRLVPDGGVEWARGRDLASFEGDGDYTVGAKLGRLPEGRFVIADIVRGRWGPDRRDAIIAGTASLDSTCARISLPQDPGQAGRTQELYLSRQLAGYRVASSPETGDKITRTDWNTALIAELRAFPYGTHDDQVDALSRAFSLLINQRPMRISDAALASV
ncbi:hypothetical protein [Paraburkholderia heleia]|uniref:hypothetical protein n=1 Tax=Paraburkholderia heleia TaxID=634127 RepID=UPI002AB674A7|nr:hypothetical protein [Paraburkholderia heleia]